MKTVCALRCRMLKQSGLEARQVCGGRDKKRQFSKETIMHQTTTLSHADAMRIITTIQQELDKRGKGAAIAVVDPHGELITFLRTDGCKLPSITIAMHKAFTAARERVPSYDVGQQSRTMPFPMTNFGDLRYVTWGGGLPIIYQGALVGAVGVSGLTEEEDIELAQLGADLFAE
jgi:glc operon protein GlcG